MSATTGVVNTMEPTELDTLARTNLTTAFGCLFLSPCRQSLSSRSYTFGVSKIMPVMAANESCSPAAATESGFATTRMSRPAHSEVSPSASRPSSGASITSTSMTQARTTEAVQPVMNVNSIITGTPQTEARRLPSRCTSTPYRNERCMPETATTWRMPETESALSSS